MIAYLEWLNRAIIALYSQKISSGSAMFELRTRPSSYAAKVFQSRKNIFNQISQILFVKQKKFFHNPFFAQRLKRL